MLREVNSPCIIAAFSGGPDSTALLHALHSAASVLDHEGKNPPVVIAAHCNFHLRGEESDRDMQFAIEFCKELGVELLTTHFDTEKYCQDRHLSIETGARELRHQWFETLCHTHNALLATGHNADDNAETMMLNLLRGSGVRGLKAMLPRQRHIMRPLLEFGRSDIIDYLKEQGLHYVTDSTNLCSDYRRNFLRNEIFPVLEGRWPGMKKGLATTLSCLADDNAIVEQAVANALPGKGEILTWKTLREFAAPRLLILRHFAREGVTPDIAEEMSRQIRQPRPGARWSVKDCNGLRTEITATSEGLFPVKGTADKEIYKWRYRKFVTDDKISELHGIPLSECALPADDRSYIWTFPVAGMRMKPLGMKGSKLVSDIIRDARLNPQEKAEVMVLCRRADRQPVWIPGVKRARIELVNPENEGFFIVSEE